VAAVDEETALEALELIQVDYEMLPAVFDSLEAMVPGAPIVHEELESYVDSAHSTRYGNVRNHQILRRGDVEEAANQILRVLEANPDNLLAREILAETYYQRGQIESALREYHTLRQQAPLGRKYDSKIQELREVAGSCGVDDLPELNPEDIDLEELIETETPISEIPAVLPTPELEATTEEILPVPAQEFSEPGSSMLTSEAAVVPEAAILSTLEKWLENIHRLYPHLGPVS